MANLKKLVYFRVFLAGVFALSLVPAGPAGAQLEGPRSLKEVPTPVPMDVTVLNNPQPLTRTVVANQAALVRLGKALFWDMQVGSDGITSCASCHFNAGADIRAKNALTPGFKATPRDTIFGNSPTVVGLVGDPPTPIGSLTTAAGGVITPTEDGVDGWGPNFTLAQGHFPFHERTPATQLVPRPGGPVDPPTPAAQEFATLLRDTNDSVSSMGVVRNTFNGIVPGNPVDAFINSPATDPLGFNFGDPPQKVRAVEPVNAPTVINALFNLDNFWNGRASTIFNGRNPFGFKVDSTQPENWVYKNVKGQKKVLQLTSVNLRISNSSLASQAVGPPLSNIEMSWEGRNFAQLGKKMLSLRPLALQKVSPTDSVLGSLAVIVDPITLVATELPTGLNTTYEKMIKDAFRPEWWNNKSQTITVNSQAVATSATNPEKRAVTKKQTVSQPTTATIDPAALTSEQFTQLQYNFPLFFGLAVQAYEMTLRADDTPFDKGTLTAPQQRGLAIFANDPAENPNPNIPLGGCSACHRLPETTNHSVRNTAPDLNGVPQALIEAMTMGDNVVAIYDTGFYNISLRPTAEDLSRGETTPNAVPFINSLTSGPFPLSYVQLAQLKVNNLLPADVARFVPDIGVLANSQVAVNGAFKTSSVRNLLLTGPYFHQGGDATLRQAVEFYVRGGNFPATNFTDFDPVIVGIPEMATGDATAEGHIQDLLDFLAFGLLDARVKDEKAPFDHPELFVPLKGISPNLSGTDDATRHTFLVTNSTPDITQTSFNYYKIPAVGAAGRTATDPPVPTFLNPLAGITP